MMHVMAGYKKPTFPRLSAWIEEPGGCQLSPGPSTSMSHIFPRLRALPRVLIIGIAAGRSTMFEAHLQPNLKVCTSYLKLGLAAVRYGRWIISASWWVEIKFPSTPDHECSEIVTPYGHIYMFRSTPRFLECTNWGS